MEIGVASEKEITHTFFLLIFVKPGAGTQTESGHIASRHFRGDCLENKLNRNRAQISVVFKFLFIMVPSEELLIDCDKALGSLFVGTFTLLINVLPFNHRLFVSIEDILDTTHI